MDRAPKRKYQLPRILCRNKGGDSIRIQITNRADELQIKGTTRQNGSENISKQSPVLSSILNSNQGYHKIPVVSKCALERNNANRVTGSSPTTPKRRKRYTDGEPQLCEVCGDESPCFHFGVRTCIACREFFRRAVRGQTPFVCKYNGTCDVSKRETRSNCHKCRFDRCIEKGMDPKLVFPHEKCMEKRLLIEMNRESRRQKTASLQLQQHRAAPTLVAIPIQALPIMMSTNNSVPHPASYTPDYVHEVPRARFNFASPPTSAVNQLLVPVPYTTLISANHTSLGQTFWGTADKAPVTFASKPRTASNLTPTTRNSSDYT